MTDRCDTDEHIFFFANDGRPFMAVRANISTNALVSELRAAWRGRYVTIGRRRGNYAAATFDELFKLWPGSKPTSEGDVIFIEPIDDAEIVEELELAA